ncbi:MAG: TonB-dependent receptor plug domain-containing protein, partial [Muribaculaceae bacterium]|nr:TonB-dependent receptor plug domain-containing protein [Muribaculaceae bacterium]
MKKTIAALAATIALPVLAHDPANLSDTVIGLHEITTVAPKVRHLNDAVNLDLKVNPVRSSQEVLRLVPGLFIAQHAGGGKAEQMFLRGFDLDHGTDINIAVDGMPVNMVSHAHGQGYADLHFVMPEVIEQVDFDKGPYNMAKGDLANAGYVEFKTRDRMNTGAAVELGMHNYQRYRATASLIDNSSQSLYATASFLSDDGFFDADQNFKRFNAMAKYTGWSDNAKFSIIASHFNSSWNASGQIPQRAVDNGLISWWGSLDPSEGGSTSRTSVQALHHMHTADGHGQLNTSMYASYYTFNLFSNFTFFLHDPVNGDEINQHERRFMGGANTEYTHTFKVHGNTWKAVGGTGVRYDMIKDLWLYHTVDRNKIGTYSLGDVGESSLWAYAGTEMNFGPFMIHPAVRVDWFKMDYTDRTALEFSNPHKSQAIVSPKLNITYDITKDLRLILKAGKGFHSNDARVVVIEKDKPTLPHTWGIDLGVKWHPVKDMTLAATGWYLYSSQEMVYVGDEAIVEPGGRTRRLGFDLSARYEFLKDFYLQCDYTYSHARSIDDPRGMNYVPLAPAGTLAAGLTWQHRGFVANAKARWLGDRPANEDYSLTADGYCIVDLTAAYTFKRFTFGMAIDNLFNT